MDLRQQKTRRSIINAFLALRSEKPLEKITVKELSERAEIHKATFYLHYHDIYELSEELEQEIVGEIFQGLSNPEDFLTNAEKLNEELYCLLISYENLLSILFSGSRSGVLVDLMEEQLKSYIFGRHPQYKDDLELNVILTYLIQGGYNAYMQYRGTPSASRKKVLLMINTMASAVLKRYLQPESSEEPQPEQETENA